MYLPIPAVIILTMLAAGGLIWCYDGLRAIWRVPQLENDIERRIAELDRKQRAIDNMVRRSH